MTQSVYSGKQTAGSRPQTVPEAPGAPRLRNDGSRAAGTYSAPANEMTLRPKAKAFGEPVAEIEHPLALFRRQSGEALL